MTLKNTVDASLSGRRVMLDNNFTISANNQNYLIYALLLISAISYLFFLWPGTLSPDSITQYKMAVSGIYTDHHPPLMSFVWRYLDKIYKGSGLLFAFHIVLLYSSTFYLIKSLENFRYKFLFLLLPWIPQVMLFSGMIWKDVGFAFSFLCVGSCLSALSLRKEMLSKKQFLLIFSILLYGTSVKFQAKYCAPIFLLWISFVLSGHQINDIKKLFVKFLILTVTFYSSLYFINRTLVSVERQDHSWQYVKIYDLAGISVALDTPFFPENNKGKNFSMEKLKEIFNHRCVDNLIGSDTAMFSLGKSEAHRQYLWRYWAKTIISHPLIYFKHRASILWYGLICIPSHETITNFYNKAADNKTAIGKIFFITSKVLGVSFLSHILTAILCFFYTILGIFSWSRTRAAIPLIFLNSTGLMMIFTLFFFSMAGTPRYTYITIVMVHASHVFAFICLASLMKRALRGSPIPIIASTPLLSAQTICEPLPHIPLCKNDNNR